MWLKFQVFRIDKRSDKSSVLQQQLDRVAKHDGEVRRKCGDYPIKYGADVMN